MLNKEKLEKLLLTQWTEFLDYQKIRSFSESATKQKIQKLSISRFELTEKGFLLWIEANNHTLEVIIDFQDNIKLNDADFSDSLS